MTTLVMTLDLIGNAYHPINDVMSIKHPIINEDVFDTIEQSLSSIILWSFAKYIPSMSTNSMLRGFREYPSTR
jgi:hypothetical protein